MIKFKLFHRKLSIIKRIAIRELSIIEKDKQLRQFLYQVKLKLRKVVLHVSPNILINDRIYQSKSINMVFLNYSTVFCAFGLVHQLNNLLLFHVHDVFLLLTIQLVNYCCHELLTEFNVLLTRLRLIHMVQIFNTRTSNN